MDKIFSILIFILCGTLVYSLNNVGRNPSLERKWTIYKNTFNKRHSDLMETNRRAVWESNLKYVERHNLDADLQKHSYHLGMNAFGDLSNDEFKALMFPGNRLHVTVSNTTHRMNTPVSNDVPPPSSLDYQTAGYVTSVKSQGLCDSAAHMAVVACYESAFYKKTKLLISFSVQQMLNCVNDNGCNGALATDVLNRIKYHGIQTDSAIPYCRKVQNCVYMEAYAINYLTSYGHIKTKNVLAMKNALVRYGPIEAGMDGLLLTFQLYRFGVYDPKLCSQEVLKHDVLIVGYAKDYWKIKNSWGLWWGQRGYAFIKSGKNQCGIESRPVYIVA